MSDETNEQPNGVLPNGVNGSMQSLPNGRPPSERDRTVSRKPSSTSIATGRSSGLESQEKRSELSAMNGIGRLATRDDGYFATNAIVKEHRLCATEVKLAAPVASGGTLEPKPVLVSPSVPTSTEASHSSSNGTLPQPLLSNPAESSLRIPRSPYRLSSPPAFTHPPTSGSGLAPTASHQHPGRLQHRHTLEVPKVSTSSRASRDLPNSSEDVVSATGRFSPNTPTKRRGSMTLARRTTRSIHSDMHLDEVPQDEDAARWTEHIRQKRASAKRKREEEKDDDRVVVGTKVDQNHVNWVTAYNMLTGIRFTVSRTNAKMDRELTDADFKARHKFSFDMYDSKGLIMNYDFKFKDYAPWVFRHLRANFGLDPADYLMSLTSKYILSELGSPGKSGSFFYFSRDYKYIIKTIHHAEHKFLRRILRDYYDHVKANPDTLLSQFYGLHRVKIPYGRKIHFVVMNNLFPPHRDIHRTFDLKGSTIGRDFKEEDLEKNPRATLKDLNWLRRNLHLEFGPTKRKMFLDQINKDVELLKRLKIMDYSLLVGIHDLERGNEENLRDKTLQVFQPGGENAEDPPQANVLMRTPSKLENARKAKELRQIIKSQKPIPLDQSTSRMPDEVEQKPNRSYFYADDGGFRATHEDDSPGEEIYYLGVIDCLTYYSLIKRTEHFLKGLTNTESQISAIPPHRYGERFVRFISGITKTRERAELEKAAQASGQVIVDTQDGTVSLSPIDDPMLSGINMHRTPTDRVMEKAERQAEKSRRHMRGSEEDESEFGEGDGGGYSLPVVEEAAESGSTGGRSGESREREHETPPLPPLPAVDGDELQQSRQSMGQKPPPTPPKDVGEWGGDEKRPRTPPKNLGYRCSHEAPPTPPKDDRGRGRHKLMSPDPPTTVVADGITMSPDRVREGMREGG
ncbi:Phosphatidylinositol-4-phosphate 5-kinase [Coniosporium tulheliwenetii]|uniref:Phosphatidylinositol-4-phosphate 5-kinase n=1 Tax=Coniosporium tulheliwenetii TaxID=3383036 RepID=A0ACC2ZHL8_9PEZI|nr:Phosphatidylinositol-4-phosphate 5-kinase [Cladosporium sp. JES 115]